MLVIESEIKGNSKWICMLFKVSHKFSPLLILVQAHFLTTHHPQLCILTQLVKFSVDSPSIKVCAWDVGVFLATRTKM